MPVAPSVDSRAERSRQDNVATVKDTDDADFCDRCFKGTQSLEKKGPDHRNRWWSCSDAAVYDHRVTHEADPSVRKAAHLDRKGVDRRRRCRRRIISGMFYTSGEGVPKDLGKQQNFSKKQPTKDMLRRRIISACHYENGEGVPKDLEKAAELFKKAADQGYPKAQYNLGVSLRKWGRCAQGFRKSSRAFSKSSRPRIP